METSLGHIVNCKKLAIMGGTFDPIHYGHLVTAETVRNEFGIEKVLFIPTGQPPHKMHEAVTNNEQRYLMTVLATVNNPYFYTSRMEIDRPGDTFTIDTIVALRKICRNDATFYFITGADAVSEIFTWKEAEKLLGLCHFVAVTRPGYNKEKLMLDVDKINEQYKSRLHFLEVPALAISSTDIRHRVAVKKAIKYLLPEEVETYIIKHELYTASGKKLDLAQITAYVEDKLSVKRFAHVMGVVSEAVKLAECYGCDTEKARAAALLHDVAKEIPNDAKEKLCQELGVECDESMKKQPDLLHPVLGAEMAKTDVGIPDEDVLNAIRYHTTGRKKMSLLEKIVFLADMIEPARVSSENSQTLKRLAYENIDDATLFGLQCKIANCEKRGLDVHPSGKAALKYYKKQVDKSTVTKP